MNRLRVVVCEDDEGFREGLCSVLNADPGFEVADAFADAESLLHAAGAARAGDSAPEWALAILDVQLPGASGIEAARRLKALRPGLPIVMLTVQEDPPTILDAICNGADGYLLKRSTPEELTEALWAIVAGGSTLTPGVARSLLGVVRDRIGHQRGAAVQFDLSERELQVLRGLAQGRSYKQVAADLSLSIDTVRTYVRRVYGKLQVHSVSEAVGEAIRAGLV